MTRKALVPLQAPAFPAAGLTGATTATRYVGGTASGAPASGTFVTGDWVVAQNAVMWVCTAGGTPGTWVSTAGSGGGTPAVSVTSETTYGITSAVGTSTNYARQDHTHGSPATPVTTLAGTANQITASASTGPVTLSLPSALTAPGTLTATGLLTADAGITVPSGQVLTTGTRSVVTGTRTTTTNASDTVNLGTFSTTGGALELRIHAHLVAGAAGATASVTKVYEVAASTVMGTLNTWYLCLPADTSALAGTANDFALEVERTGAGTFAFRFRQVSIAATGVITFTVETLGDTAVTFTASTTVTAAPSAVTALHPSNGLCVAAGSVGIGTESPNSPLHAVGAGEFSAASGANAVLALHGNGQALGSALMIAGAVTTGYGFTDTLANDSIIGVATGTLRLGTILSGSTGKSTVQITSTDALIYDAGLAAARTIPRGKCAEAHLTANTAQNIAATTMTTVNGTVSLNGAAGVAATNLAVVVPCVNGRTYKITVTAFPFSSVASDSVIVSLTESGSTGTLVGNAGARVTVPAINAVVPHVTVWYFYATSTASTTFTVQENRQTGSGNVNMAAGSSICVEDCGT